MSAGAKAEAGWMHVYSCVWHFHITAGDECLPRSTRGSYQHNGSMGLCPRTDYSTETLERDSESQQSIGVTQLGAVERDLLSKIKGANKDR